MEPEVFYTVALAVSYCDGYNVITGRLHGPDLEVIDQRELETTTSYGAAYAGTLRVLHELDAVARMLLPL